MTDQAVVDSSTTYPDSSAQFSVGSWYIVLKLESNSNRNQLEWWIFIIAGRVKGLVLKIVGGTSFSLIESGVHIE